MVSGTSTDCRRLTSASRVSSTAAGGGATCLGLAAEVGAGTTFSEEVSTGSAPAEFLGSVDIVVKLVANMTTSLQ